MLCEMKRLSRVLALLCPVAIVTACGAPPEAPVASGGSEVSAASVPVEQAMTTTTKASIAPVATTSIALTTVATTAVTSSSGPPVTGDRYETVTTILASSEHGPELCLGGIAASNPPLCGGVPITNWNWNAIDGEQIVGDTTWVDHVYVAGPYDGTAFTVDTVRPATADDNARFATPQPDFHAPCPAPPGGWLAAAAGADPNAMLSGDGPIAQYVASQPDAGGWWGDPSINPNWPNGDNDPRKVIVVATFTGDLARHETDLRKLWSGAVCVWQAKHSAAELHDLAVKVTADIGTGGTLTLPNGTVLRVLGFSQEGNMLTGTVDLDVMVAYPAAQQWYDDTYGPGRVVLNAQMRLVTRIDLGANRTLRPAPNDEAWRPDRSDDPGLGIAPWRTIESALIASSGLSPLSGGPGAAVRSNR